MENHEYSFAHLPLQGSSCSQAAYRIDAHPAPWLRLCLSSTGGGSSSGWLSSRQHGHGSSHGLHPILPGISLKHHCQDIELVHLQLLVDHSLLQRRPTAWRAHQLPEHHLLSRRHHQHNPIWLLPLLQAHLWLQHHRQHSSQWPLISRLSSQHHWVQSNGQMLHRHSFSLCSQRQNWRPVHQRLFHNHSHRRCQHRCPCRPVRHGNNNASSSQCHCSNLTASSSKKLSRKRNQQKVPRWCMQLPRRCLASRFPRWFSSVHGTNLTWRSSVAWKWPSLHGKPSSIVSSKQPHQRDSQRPRHQACHRWKLCMRLLKNQKW